MKSFLKFSKDLLFPPRCAGCHTLMPPSAEEVVFCADCKKEWGAELCLQCPDCFAAYGECRCQPQLLVKEGSRGLIKLAPYGDTARERVVRRIVLDMKKQPRRRVIRLLAEELAGGVLAEMGRLGWEREHVLLAHLPRDKRKVRREGVDQSVLLARALAKACGLPHARILYRTKHAKTQKKLSAKERALNLKDAFAVKDEPKDVCVILIDDVVTTGASLSAGAHALRQAGVKEFFCVSVAQTPKKH